MSSGLQIWNKDGKLVIDTEKNRVMKYLGNFPITWVESGKKEYKYSGTIAGIDLTDKSYIIPLWQFCWLDTSLGILEINVTDGFSSTDIYRY